MPIRIKQVVPVTGDFLLDQATRDYIGKYLDSDTVVDVDAVSYTHLDVYKRQV